MNIRNKNHLSLSVVALIALSHNASAAFLYNDLETAETSVGSGVYNFVNGNTGWSGSGAIVGPSGFGNTSGNKMIQGFSGSGTLNLGVVTPYVQQGGFSTASGITATMAIDIGSGSGDLNINTITGNLSPNGFHVNNLIGVSSITVDINFSVPMTANFYAGNNITNLGTTDITSDPATERSGAPFLSALRFLGSTSAASSWDVSAQYTGLQYSTDGLDRITGLPAGAVAVDAKNSESTWGTGGSSSSWTATGTGGSDWQGINGFDPNGGDFTTGQVNDHATLYDTELIFATGISYTITSTGGEDLDGSSFIFSTSGGQSIQNVPVIVPEPTSTFLLSLGISSFMMHRRKS